MKNDILQRLTLAINALNNVEVRGKANLANLSGSISLLEEIKAAIEALDIDCLEQKKDN